MQEDKLCEYLTIQTLHGFSLTLFTTTVPHYSRAYDQRLCIEIINPEKLIVPKQLLSPIARARFLVFACV